MKGIIFTTVARVVTEAHGADLWDDLLVAAGLEGAYTTLGDYPSAELLALATAAGTALEAPVEDVVRWLGRAAIPHVHARYPHFFGPRDLAAFLGSLDGIIHPEVRKLHPGAAVPSFDVVEPSPDEDADDGLLAVMTYRSPRSLCWLAEGFVHGAADHYDTAVVLRQPTCKHAGADHCVIEVRTRAAQPTGAARTTGGSGP